MAEIKCPKCGMLNADTNKFCSQCGHVLLGDDVENKGHLTPADIVVGSAGNASHSSNDDTVKVADDATQIVDATSNSDETKIVGEDTSVIEDGETESLTEQGDGLQAAFYNEDKEPGEAGAGTIYLEPEKKRNVWVWLLPLLLVLGLLAAGAVYYFGFRSNESLRSESADDKTENVDDALAEEDDQVVITEEVDPDMSVTPDRIFNDVHGPVEKLVTEQATFEFDALGNMVQNENVSYERNGNGFITEATMQNDDGSVVNVTYSYEGNHITRMIFTFSDGSLINDCFYNSDGTMSKVVQRISIYPSWRNEVVYSDYIFDKHHNWISRTLTTTTGSTDEYDQTQKETQTTTESRQISYYE